MIFLFSLLLLFSSGKEIKSKYHKAIRIEDPLEAMKYFQGIFKEAPNTPYADSSLFRIAMFYYIIEDYEQTINTLEVIYNKGHRGSLYKKACYWLEISYRNIGDTLKSEEFTITPESLMVDIEKDTILQNVSVFWTVQLAAYRERDWAERFYKRLVGFNIEAYTRESKNLIKVYSGKFTSRAKAEGRLKYLKDKGFDGFIVKLKP